MLMNSLSRWKGSMCFVPLTVMLPLRSIASDDVKVVPQVVQVRRRQTRLRRFCGREFTTLVSLLQYMHTMTTCCHIAVNITSGKL